MPIYRERFFAYFFAGAVAILLGFLPALFISQIVQPAVGVWIVSSAVVIFWGTVSKSFRDPMVSILGIPLRAFGVFLAIVGIAFIAFSVFTSSIRLGGGGVVSILFALDTYLSAQESVRRANVNNRFKKDVP